MDASGNLYIADSGNNRLRKVTAANGNITTIAGDGTRNFAGDNGPAISAQIENPQGVALTASGNFYIADNARIRKISGGIISTVAGNGTAGSIGDNGPANTAELSQPEGIAIDNSNGSAAGSLYIADSANNRVRKGGAQWHHLDRCGRRHAGLCASGSGSATSAQLNDPEDVTVDPSGNVYIADSGNGCVRKLAPNGSITTVAGFTGTSRVTRVMAEPPLCRTTELFPVGSPPMPRAISTCADFGNGRVRKVATNGIITTVAGYGVGDSTGSGGPAIQRGTSAPRTSPSTAAGNLLHRRLQ